jgi:hypothetical protein
MIDILCEGSLKSNGVCISDLREFNSTSYPILMESEGMMQKAERSKDPNTVGCYRAPEMAPMTSITEKFGTFKCSYRPPAMAPASSLPEKLDLFIPTTKGSHAAPGRAPLTSLANNLDHHGTSRSRVEDSSESSNAPAALLVKGRKRLRQASSSDEEDEHAVCAASSPEY